MYSGKNIVTRLDEEQRRSCSAWPENASLLSLSLNLKNSYLPFLLLFIPEKWRVTPFML
jgi:hypothetical protein